MVLKFSFGGIIRGTEAERLAETWTNLPVDTIFIENNTDRILRWSGAGGWKRSPAAFQGYTYVVYIDPDDGNKCKVMNTVTGKVEFAASSSTANETPITSVLAMGKDIIFNSDTFTLGTGFNTTGPFTFPLGKRIMITGGRQTVLSVPNGYAKPVFRLQKGTTADGGMSNNFIDGFRFNEQGATPLRNWTAIELFADGADGSGPQGISFNTFRDIHVQDALSPWRIHKETTTGWANSNLFENFRGFNCKYFGEFTRNAAVTGVLHNINENHWKNSWFQFSSGVSLGGVTNIEGRWNVFEDYRIWDIYPLSTYNTCNVTNSAQDTIFIGGNLNQSLLYNPSLDQGVDTIIDRGLGGQLGSNPTPFGIIGVYHLTEGPDYVIFKDTKNEPNPRIVARNNRTGKYQFTHATDLGNVLNSCASALTTGGSILITHAPSIYDFATQVSIATGKIEIRSENGAIIKPTAAFANNLFNVTAADFWFRNNYIDCSLMTSGSGSAMLLGVNSANCKIENNTILEPASHGIVSSASSTTNSLFQNNRIECITRVDPTGSGLSLSNNQLHSITNNTISGFKNASAGFGILGSATNGLRIINNRIYNCRLGISCFASNDFIVKDNVIESCSQDGIRYNFSTTGPFRNILIQNNRIQDNGLSGTAFDGILLMGSVGTATNVSLIGNVCIETKTTGNRQRWGINASVGAAFYPNGLIVGNVCAGNIQTTGINNVPVFVTAGNQTS